jgi:hypothetical protein
VSRPHGLVHHVREQGHLIVGMHDDDAAMRHALLPCYPL